MDDKKEFSCHIYSVSVCVCVFGIFLDEMMGKYIPTHTRRDHITNMIIIWRKEKKKMNKK